jgi:hypothetical protein
MFMDVPLFKLITSYSDQSQELTVYPQKHAALNSETKKSKKGLTI